MQIEAEVSSDGVLTARLPDRYRGRHVRISIEDEDECSASQWAELSEILDRLDTQAMPRRRHEEILQSLREFRESE